MNMTLVSARLTAAAAGVRVMTMPSLFRFLMFLGVLGGLGYGAVFSLARFVEPKQREITVTIQPDKFYKNH
jgi:bacteriorhodopsin